jgi:hypothetical protein
MLPLMSRALTANHFLLSEYAINVLLDAFMQLHLCIGVVLGRCGTLQAGFP